MKDLFITDTETLYRSFKQIPEHSYREQIRFVDVQKQNIEHLSFQYWIDIKLTYTFALFEIGSYERFLNHADEMIEKVIMHNIYYHRHEDVYCELLFRKAAALFNTGKISEAIVIIEQIIQIDHTHKFAAPFLQKCLSIQQRHNKYKIQAAGILLLLAGTAFMAAELLLVKPFLPDLATHANMLRYGFLIPGIILLLWSEVYNRLITHLTVAEKVRISAKRQRNNN